MRKQHREEGKRVEHSSNGREKGKGKNAYSSEPEESGTEAPFHSSPNRSLFGFLRKDSLEDHNREKTYPTHIKEQKKAPSDNGEKKDKNGKKMLH